MTRKIDDKSYRFFIGFTLLAFLSILFIQCGKIQVPKNDITVSILPQRYMARQIIGMDVDVNVMVPPGHNPAAYSPSPEQIQRLSASKVYFEIGYLPFERFWLKKQKKSFPHLKFINLSEKLDMLKMERGHSHGSDPHDNDENEWDPHVWLSPKAVKNMSGVIYRTFLELYPEKKNQLTENYQAWLKRIDEADSKIKKILAGLENTPFIVYHPSWGYFCRHYGLKQIPIEHEGKEPNPEYLRHVIEMAKNKNIKLIIIQKQFDIEKAKFIAEELNIPIVRLDPLAEEWDENLVFMAQSIKRVLCE